MTGQKRPHRLAKLSGLLLVSMIVGVAALATLRVVSSSRERDHLKAEQGKGRAVEVARVARSEPEKKLLLVGDTRPYYSVTLYARVSGYLRIPDGVPMADVGDTVTENQILATVESPESELAFQGARADALNKGKISERMKVLLRRKLISPQEAEQAFAASDIADATLRTQAVLRGYQIVRAPFSGRITQRFVDPGTLLQNASGAQSASQPLYVISQTSRIRVFAYVDQENAPFVKVGDALTISVPAQPDSSFEAKIERIANALDPQTRTLQIQTTLDNPKDQWVAGSFVQVHMKVERPTYLELPAKALVMRGKETLVPIVQKDQRIHYSKIDLAEDDGLRILVRSGLEAGERVALNIGNSLQEGQMVQVTEGKATQLAGQVGK